MHAWLPQLIERIRERYPSVAIDLNTDTSLNLAREVAERKIDLALIMGPVFAPDLINLDLCTFACTWLASPKLQLPTGRLSLAEVAHHPILAYSKDSLPHHRVLRLLADAGIEDPTIYNSNSLADHHPARPGWNWRHASTDRHCARPACSRHSGRAERDTRLSHR